MGEEIAKQLSVLALSSRFDGRSDSLARYGCQPTFQYSLCRVVLMVDVVEWDEFFLSELSVLALSSRFDGLWSLTERTLLGNSFQYSLCRVVLMVSSHGRSTGRR